MHATRLVGLLSSATLALCLVAAEGEAQRVDQLRAARLEAPRPMAAEPGFAVAGLAEPAAADSDTRSPIVAGLLSYVVPGVGSYYAGNVRHGHTHLLLHVALVGVAISAAVNCEVTAPCGTVDGALAGMVINWGWSIVTAVGDARTRNRALQPAAVGGQP